jgi:hypothetical protein
VGIEAKYTVTIVKSCDGCGERWEARQTFSSVNSVLSFGGPVEAAEWEIHIADDGRANLLCGKCAEHVCHE